MIQMKRALFLTVVFLFIVLSLKSYALVPLDDVSESKESVSKEKLMIYFTGIKEKKRNIIMTNPANETPVKERPYLSKFITEKLHLLTAGESGKKPEPRRETDFSLIVSGLIFLSTLALSFLMYLFYKYAAKKRK